MTFIYLSLPQPKTRTLEYRPILLLRVLTLLYHLAGPLLLVALAPPVEGNIRFLLQGSVPPSPRSRFRNYHFFSIVMPLLVVS